jgi:hypothetical protein
LLLPLLLLLLLPLLPLLVRPTLASERQDAPYLHGNGCAKEQSDLLHAALNLHSTLSSP